eukprot:72857_1
MGHNLSTPSRKKLNRKSNSVITNCESTRKTQSRLSLKLTSQPSLSSEESASPRFSQSISSIQSADFSFDCQDVRSIKDLMIDRLNTKQAQNDASIAQPVQMTAPNTVDYEKLFISFHQKQQQIRSDMTVYDATIQHRVAFISLVGLYQSFRRVPTHILFSSLFILKIRREWLYDASTANDTRNVLRTLQFDEDEDFMMLLKWKDSQGLLLFMWNEDTASAYPPTTSDIRHELDTDDVSDHELPIDFGIESDHEDDLTGDSNQFALPLPRFQRLESHYPNPVVRQERPAMDAFNTTQEPNALWMQLSHALSGIYDPYSGSNYTPLILNPHWWLNDLEESQYGASSNDVLNEIYECPMKYRCVMEILFQSNPSLIPCKTYRELAHVSTATHRKPRAKKVELSEINAISNTFSAVESTTDYLDDDIVYTPFSIDELDLDAMFQIN